MTAGGSVDVRNGPQPASERLEILYQDAHLVAVHKPSGLLVHRTALDRHETRFVVQILRDQLDAWVHPVHRLDKGTSGILLLALDRETAAVLGKGFEEGQVDKRYVAIVRGHTDERGTIDHPLQRRPDDAEWVPAGYVPPTQPAVTRYRRLATAELAIAVDRYPSSRYSLVELEPLTGRRHQLRRHLKHISHPIIGDATYGKGRHNRMFQQEFGCGRLLLACVELRLHHPVSGEPLILSTPPADDFAAVAKALGWSEVLATIGCLGVSGAPGEASPAQ